MEALLKAAMTLIRWVSLIVSLLSAARRFQRSRSVKSDLDYLDSGYEFKVDWYAKNDCPVKDSRQVSAPSPSEDIPP